MELKKEINDILSNAKYLEYGEVDKLTEKLMQLFGKHTEYMNRESKNSFICTVCGGSPCYCNKPMDL